MELSPEVLRDVRFTERFRGYDAAEVDAFLNEAAGALEELVAERSEPLAALAAERARLAIEQVRRETLEEIAGLQSRRDDLAQAIADLQLMLADRRRGLVEALALIDATAERASAAAPRIEAGEPADAEASHEPGGPEAKATDELATDEPATPGDPADAEASEVPGGPEGEATDEPAVASGAAADSFLARLERAAAGSGESSG